MDNNRPKFLQLFNFQEGLIGNEKSFPNGVYLVLGRVKLTTDKEVVVVQSEGGKILACMSTGSRFSPASFQSGTVRGMKFFLPRMGRGSVGKKSATIHKIKKPSNLT